MGWERPRAAAHCKSRKASQSRPPSAATAARTASRAPFSGSSAACAGQNRPAHIHQKNPAARTSSARYSRFVSFIVLSPFGRGRVFRKTFLYIRTIIFRFLDTIFKSFFKKRKLCRIRQFSNAETVQKGAKTARTKKVRAAAPGSTCYNTGRSGGVCPLRPTSTEWPFQTQSASGDLMVKPAGSPMPHTGFDRL